jgi:hypothetical protein
VFDLADHETYALSITNIGLGIAIVLCCLAVLRGLLLDLFEKAFRPKANTDPAAQYNTANPRPTVTVPKPAYLHGANDLLSGVLGYRASQMSVDSGKEPRRVHG